VTQALSINSSLKYGYACLKSLDNSRLEAEVLLAHVLNVARSHLYAHDKVEISAEDFAKYQTLCLQRRQGVPLAYLLGVREFWSLELEVNASTLIPRPETELLVEVVLQELNAHAPLTLIELGLGSGAIAIAIAGLRTNWHILGVERSQAALQVASRNIAKYRLTNITIVQSDWFACLPDNKVDAIYSNPPYIAEDDPHLQELRYEPREALVAGPEGLEAFRKIIPKAGAYLKKGGLLAFEHGYDQAVAVQKLLRAHNYIDIESHVDLSGQQRVTTGIYS
jgi:release factor glutamine methyltransferase